MIIFRRCWAHGQGTDIGTIVIEEIIEVGGMLLVGLFPKDVIP